MVRSVGPGAAVAPPELANSTSTSDPSSTADRARSRGAFQREFAWLMRIFPPWLVLTHWFYPCFKSVKHRLRIVDAARVRSLVETARCGVRGGTSSRTFRPHQGRRRER